MTETAGDEAPKKLVVAGREITVTHPGRIYFPDAGLTKFDVLSYVAQAGEAMARYTRNRALALRRYPRGIDQKGFFQKRVGGYFPDWLRTAILPTGKGPLEYALGGDAAAFVWMAGLGTIEFHAMLSRADKPHLPDQIIFDLDPPVDYTDDVRLAALGLKAICDDLRLTCFVKTTGSRGFHVILPIRREHDFDATRAFAKLLAARLMDVQPGKLTLDMKKAQRQGRILVDVWRNGYGQTAVAPYSLRARPGAPVAVPRRWADLESPDIHPRAVTLQNFAANGAHWTGIWPETLGPACSIGAAWKALGG